VTLVEGLPEAARRWLVHAIEPGTPLWNSVEIDMTGRIRLGGSWRPFSARQLIEPARGFIWAATVRAAGLPIRGYDRYTSGVCEMRWELLGAIPILVARDDDVTRSARGRLAGEGVLVPTAFVTADWADGTTADTVVMTRRIHDGTEAARLTVAGDGSLTDVTMSRWGNPDGTTFRRCPFGVTVAGEGTFEGVTIPTVFSAGWWHGTERERDGEFFRATVTSARFPGSE
jgi:hypothetical protein